MISKIKTQDGRWHLRTSLKSCQSNWPGQWLPVRHIEECGVWGQLRRASWSPSTVTEGEATECIYLSVYVVIIYIYILTYIYIIFGLKCEGVFKWYCVNARTILLLCLNHWAWKPLWERADLMVPAVYSMLSKAKSVEKAAFGKNRGLVLWLEQTQA